MIATTAQIKYFNSLIADYAPSPWISPEIDAKQVIAGLTSGSGATKGRIIKARGSEENITLAQELNDFALQELNKIDLSTVAKGLMSDMIDGAKKSPAAALVEYMQIKHDAEKIALFLGRFTERFVVQHVDPSFRHPPNPYHDKPESTVAIVTEFQKK